MNNNFNPNRDSPAVATFTFVARILLTVAAAVILFVDWLLFFSWKHGAKATDGPSTEPAPVTNWGPHI